MYYAGYIVNSEISNQINTRHQILKDNLRVKGAYVTVNITCIYVEHYILLLTILGELSEEKDGREGSGGKGTNV